MAVTHVRDSQTESARPRARSYEYPVIGSIQHGATAAGRAACNEGNNNVKTPGGAQRQRGSPLTEAEYVTMSDGYLHTLL